MVPVDLHRQGPLSDRTTDGMMATSRITMLIRSTIRTGTPITPPANQASPHIANCLPKKGHRRDIASDVTGGIFMQYGPLTTMPSP